MINYSSLINKINVHYQPNLLTEEEANRYFDILEKNVTYNSPEESKFKIFGKEVDIPRKQVGYGAPGLSYKFANTTVHAKPWDDDDIVCNTLIMIKKRVELVTKKKFNFVLINRYEDGNQYIGFHRDDEKELGDKPDVVGVSLGAERTIKFKSKENDNKYEIELQHGSMVSMLWPTNEYWQHSIPKQPLVETPRISLTFRYIYDGH